MRTSDAIIYMTKISRYLVHAEGNIAVVRQVPGLKELTHQSGERRGANTVANTERRMSGSDTALKKINWYEWEAGN